MSDVKKNMYDYYPERITQVVLEHELIGPEQRSDFERFIRGC